VLWNLVINEDPPPRFSSFTSRRPARPYLAPPRNLAVEPRRALVLPLRARPLPSPRPVGTSPGSPSSPSPPSDAPLPPAVTSLLSDFRLLVNLCLRHALATKTTSRAQISRFGRTQAADLRLLGAFGITASEIALGLARAHRKRLRHGRPSRLPCVRTPFLRTPASAFHFDPETGKVRLSLRRAEWASFVLPVSAHARAVLADPRHRVTQLHLNERRVVLIYARASPPPYAPTSVVALDTNERSLDGVELRPEGPTYVRVLFPELRTIQAIHFGRRRYLGRRKARDRRVQRRLLAREGWRERHRIRSRLHALTRSLVRELARSRSALVLEDLSALPRPRRRPSSGFRSRPLRRRLSSWPRGELHRQLAYKAQDAGVPVVWVDPFRSSITCPVCGELNQPRRRVGPRFRCAACGWETDRQLNAGVNLARTALRTVAELGGLRLDPDALSEDAVKLLYPVGGSRSGTGGAEGEGGTSSGAAGGRRLEYNPRA
jgi:IS605 OrfB family transposase